MKLLLKILSVVVIFGFSLDSYAMMKEMSVNDRIADMSQQLQKISLRDYKGLEKDDGNQTVDKNIKAIWFDSCIAGIESIMDSDKETYKDLKQLFVNVKYLSSQLFDAVMKINSASGLTGGSVKARKEEIDKLAKKQSEIKRFLLGQKAKSFFSFGKKQDEYKKMRQLLLGMIDMLNAKIDAMKKSVK